MQGTREVQTKGGRTTQRSGFPDPTDNVQVYLCEEPFLEPLERCHCASNRN